MRRWVVMVMVVLALGWPASGQEQTSDRSAQPLTMRLLPASMVARTGSPMLLDVELTWNGGGLLRGHLELILHDGFEPSVAYRTQELALVTGVQTMRLLMPVVPEGFGRGAATLRASFVAGDRTLELPTASLATPPPDERNLVVLHGHAEIARSEHISTVLASLRPERFVPPRDETQRPPGLSTTLARLHVSRLPEEAIGYCAFNLVMLDGEAFSRMEGPAVEALRTWVWAGGSLCLLADRALSPTHEAFINTLLGAAPDASFMLDPAGRLMPPAEASGPVHVRSAELGRVVIVTERDGTTLDLNSPAWRDAVAYLWKLSKPQREAVATEGQWREELHEPSSIYDPYRRYTAEEDDSPVLYHPQPTAGSGELPALLLPSSVSLLPLSVVVWILLLFTLAIGPGDYFLLGLLRRRRWTWITFPAMAVGFTLLTMMVAQRYMGSTDHRMRMAITDVGEGGRPLRCTTYDMLFVGSHTEAATEAAHQLLVPIDLQDLNVACYGGFGGWHNASDSTSPPAYVGQLPGRYVLVQAIQQWTPQINRTLTLGDAGAPVVDLDWEALDVPELPEDVQSDHLAARLVNSLTQPDVHLLLYRGDDCIALQGDRHVLRQLARQRAGHHYYWAPSDDGNDDFLTQICRRGRDGIFTAVSRLSPAGGPAFEDLTLLDRADPTQWLLVAVQVRPDQILITRRLYGEKR